MFEVLRKLICPICGKKFTTTSRVQKYCCIECYNKSQLQSKKDKKTYQKTLRKEKEKEKRRKKNGK